MAATAAAIPEVPLGRSSEWARKYPPLLALLVALLIGLVVLPSSLNVPQSNPSTTLEFAPVPPEDDTPPPPQSGNLSSLGLAGSSGLQSGGAPGGDAAPGPGDVPPEGDGLPPPLDAPAGIGKSPRTKACVGNPPRQTEDPLAPPCVADFSGDNFGATYQGVTGEEVKVLFYLQGFTNNTNTCRDPNQTTPDGEYFDLAEPPKDGEHCYLRGLRVWQTYFNKRFQTYGRFVHFYAYYSGAGSTAEERKADAADNFAKIKPFAVISTADSFQSEYLESMAKRGVLAFDSSFGRPAAFFQKYAGRIWGYQPSQEQVANMFVGLLCTKVMNQPVVQTGNTQDMGKPRKYGLVYTSDKGKGELIRFKDLVKAQVKSQCGMEFAAEATFPSADYVQDNRYPPTYASQAMADFKQQGITTIIWPGGIDTQFSKAGAAIDYRPEIILAGDRAVETDTTGTFQEQSFWQNTFVMTNVTVIGDETRTPCYLAYRETDPEADDVDARISGCGVYDPIRQLFTGIQVAGPRLTPQTMDKGYHAIPKVKSDDPSVPACYYETGDYTCIKDAMLEKWERTGGNDGCYVPVENGARYTADSWPAGNINAQYQPSATPTCNDYDSGFLVNPNPPDADLPA